MSRNLRSLALPAAAVAAAALAMAVAPPSQAASSTASSVSDSIGTSVGSVSTSIERSSRSSTQAVAQIEGDYTITAVAAVAERPGMLRLALRAKQAEGDAKAEDADFFLYLPEAAVAQAQLKHGQGVTATARPYGTEFSKTVGRQAFFLVLKDEWLRELNSQALPT